MGFGTTTIDFCPSCCGGFDCDYEGDLQLTLADFDPCGCRQTNTNVSVNVTSFSGLNGAFLLTKSPGDDFWRAEGGSLELSIYDDGTCTGEVTETNTYYETIFVFCVDDVPRLRIIFSFGGYTNDPFAAGLTGFQVNPVELDVEQNNEFICGGLFGQHDVAGGTALLEMA